MKFLMRIFRNLLNHCITLHRLNLKFCHLLQRVNKMKLCINKKCKRNIDKFWKNMKKLMQNSKVKETNLKKLMENQNKIKKINKIYSNVNGVTFKIKVSLRKLTIKNNKLFNKMIKDAVKLNQKMKIFLLETIQSKKKLFYQKNN